jgi:RNA-directed DNA polymerase
MLRLAFHCCPQNAVDVRLVAFAVGFQPIQYIRVETNVLEAIYEQDFVGFSYGFRPKRNTHDAMDALIVGIEQRKVNWILDLDLRSFFDSVSHEWLVSLCARRRLLALRLLRFRRRECGGHRSPDIDTNKPNYCVRK